MRTSHRPQKVHCEQQAEIASAPQTHGPGQDLAHVRRPETRVDDDRQRRGRFLLCERVCVMSGGCFDEDQRRRQSRCCSEVNSKRRKIGFVTLFLIYILLFSLFLV